MWFLCGSHAVPKEQFTLITLPFLGLKHSRCSGPCTVQCPSLTCSSKSTSLHSIWTCPSFISKTEGKWWGKGLLWCLKSVKSWNWVFQVPGCPRIEPRNGYWMTEWYTDSVKCCVLGQVLGALIHGGFYGRRLRALLPLVWDEEYFQKETICILIFFIIVPLLGKKKTKKKNPQILLKFV